ncbi:MAG: hypothetical protein ABIH53_01205 [archaeon]
MLDDTHIDHPDSVKAEDTRRIRESYNLLQQQFGSLPERIGIITCDLIGKSYYRMRLKELQEYGIKVSTHYLPLVMAKYVKNLLKEDSNHILEANCQTREISYAVCMLATMLQSEYNIPSAATIIPGLRHICGKMPSIISLMEQKGFKTQEIEEIHKKNSCTLATATNLVEKIFAQYEQDFRCHKVSMEFPLYYNIGFLPPIFRSVNLEEGKRYPEYLINLREWLIREDPRIVLPNMEQYAIDNYGSTEKVGTLEGLLNRLPTEKVIITDSYIMHLLPDLRKMEFTAHELQIGLHS